MSRQRKQRPLSRKERKALREIEQILNSQPTLTDDRLHFPMTEEQEHELLQHNNRNEK